MFHHHKHSAMGDLTLDTPNTAYANSYAIVASTATIDDNNWNSVVNHLVERHPNAALVIHTKNDFKAIKSGLKKKMPRYVAFVCQPDECGRVFVSECHRLMRSLDNEPYIDAMWSIITGFDAEHAIKSIDNDSVQQPFIIQKSINFTSVNQDLFEKCFTFSDGKKGCWFSKNYGIDDGSGEEKDEGEEFPKPPAQIFADILEQMEPDLLVTTGHGTEQSVEMPWSTGTLKVHEQGLALLDEDDEPIGSAIESSTNPKVFLPIANCLVGHCEGSQCMVTTFLGRMGVRQMCGYTVRTWAGRAGWGTFDLWKGVPGLLTLSDAYFLHQARMTYELKSINPRLLNFKFDVSDDDPGYETVTEQLDKQYHLDDANLDDKTLQDIYGLCYDRDTFVCYGDPAFAAQLDEDCQESLVQTKFLRTGKKTHQFVIEYKDAETAQDYHLPIGKMFTNRIENYNIVNGFEYSPVISDNFLLLLKPTPRDKESTTITIDFRGTIIE